MIFNWNFATDFNRGIAYVIMPIAISFFLFLGCNLLKHTTSDLYKSHELEETDTRLSTTAQKENISMAGSVSFHQDSSDIDYSIQIWPKGMFSFSAEKGFSGEAEKVMVTGKAKSGSVSSVSSSSFHQDKVKIQQQLSQQRKKVSDLKTKSKKSKPSWKWLVASMAFITALCCFLYSKVKIFFNRRTNEEEAISAQS